MTDETVGHSLSGRPDARRPICSSGKRHQSATTATFFRRRSRFVRVSSSVLVARGGRLVPRGGVGSPGATARTGFTLAKVGRYRPRARIGATDLTGRSRAIGAEGASKSRLEKCAFEETRAGQDMLTSQPETSTPS